MNSFYTPKEISKILKINYNRVLQLIHLGELAAMKIGSDYRISDLDLYNFLESNKYSNSWIKKKAS